MKYDLYPILISELEDLYSIINNENKLYKYIYIRSLIWNKLRVSSKLDLTKFILFELNISIFNDEYIIYKDKKYPLLNWHNEFIENLEFRAELEGSIDIKETKAVIFKKGYTKARKFKDLEAYKDYIEYYRFKALNSYFEATPVYSEGVKGFKNSANHNPYKRSLEESLEVILNLSRFTVSNTTSYITEEQLEDYLVENIQTIEKGMRFVNRQVKVKDGIVDIIAKDKHDNFCIIEIKIKEDKSLLWQTIHYPEAIKEKYNILFVRMITVSPKYRKHIKRALLKTKGVEMYDYKIKVEEGNIKELVLNKVGNDIYYV